MTRLLNPGDEVALISPSISLRHNLDINVETVVRFLNSLEFEVRVVPTVWEGRQLTEDSDKNKAQDIMRMYAHSRIKALFSIHGGAGSLRVLPYLDFDVIKKNPKPFIGFSDNSSIQMGIYAQTGLPYISGFSGEYEFRNGTIDPLVAHDLKAVLAGEKFSAREGKTLRSGKAEGVLIGGNLSILSDLNGTPFYPNIKDCILLIEDEEEPPYKISLMLTQLRLNPMFEKVRGVVFGKFSQCERENSTFGTIDDVIADFVRQVKIPVIRDFNYGHFPARHVLTLGVPYQFDADNCLLEQI